MATRGLSTDDGCGGGNKSQVRFWTKEQLKTTKKKKDFCQSRRGSSPQVLFNGRVAAESQSQVDLDLRCHWTLTFSDTLKPFLLTYKCLLHVWVETELSIQTTENTPTQPLNLCKIIVTRHSGSELFIFCVGGLCLSGQHILTFSGPRFPKRHKCTCLFAPTTVFLKKITGC